MEKAQAKNGGTVPQEKTGVDWPEGVSNEALVAKLRALGERFIFQGGSAFANDLAQRLEALERRAESLDRQLKIAEGMYKVVLAERNLARAHALFRDPVELVGSITRHTDGSVRLWGLKDQPYLDTAVSLRNLYAPEEAVIGERVVDAETTPPQGR